MTNAVMPTYARSNLTFEKGSGPYLENNEGERYLDFGAGIAVNLLGHAHPRLVEALTSQAQKLWHTSNLYQIPGQERLAETLVAQSFADTVFFSNSGAEALECAIKTARKYHAALGNPNRYCVITFEAAFHGRTLATLAAGGQEKHLEGFGPPMDGFDQVPYGDIDAAHHAIREQTAAILVEPIQGESGIQVPEDDFLACLRDICDAHSLLLIVDEVQTGMGRTGKLFAYEWSGIEPDILATAKGLGGGFPIGACLATKEAAKGMVAGSHGSTFGGNPLAMAVGNAVMDEILSDGFLGQVQQVSATLRNMAEDMAAKYPTIIESVRGKGMMLGLKCKVPNQTLVKALQDNHLLTVGAGDNVVRFLPPLNITAEHITEAKASIEKACAQLAASSSSAS